MRSKDKVEFLKGSYTFANHGSIRINRNTQKIN